MQHLETATALISQLHGDEELSVLDRNQLNEAAAETGVLVDHLVRIIAGDSLETELARLLAQIQQTGE